MYLAQAKSTLTQLKKMQTERLKNFFPSSAGSNDEQRKADLELNFKKLMQQCKAKLSEITKGTNSLLTSEDQSENDTALTVAQNVTQSVLIKMQELSSDYSKYQARQRNIGDKYEVKEETADFSMTLDSFDSEFGDAANDLDSGE